MRELDLFPSLKDRLLNEDLGDNVILLIDRDYYGPLMEQMRDHVSRMDESESVLPVHMVMGKRIRSVRTGTPGELKVINDDN